jgi:hypothetical protein
MVKFGIAIALKQFIDGGKGDGIPEDVTMS